MRRTLVALCALAALAAFPGHASAGNHEAALAAGAASADITPPIGTPMFA